MAGCHDAGSLHDPRLTVIRSEDDLGSASGFSAPIAAARDRLDPDLFVLLDDDARPLPGTLADFLTAVLNQMADLCALIAANIANAVFQQCPDESRSVQTPGSSQNRHHTAKRLRHARTTGLVKPQRSTLSAATGSSWSGLSTWTRVTQGGGKPPNIGAAASSPRWLKQTFGPFAAFLDVSINEHDEMTANQCWSGKVKGADHVVDALDRFHHAERLQQPGLAALPREDMTAEVADRSAERQFRFARGAEFARRMAGLGIVLVEGDLLFERPMPESRAHEIEHHAIDSHDAWEMRGIDSAQVATDRSDESALVQHRAQYSDTADRLAVEAFGQDMQFVSTSASLRSNRAMRSARVPGGMSRRSSRQ